MRVIVNGTVYTMAGPVWRPGTVLIDGGKIVDVGERLVVPPDAEVIDAAFSREQSR
ncbi:MAG TPA: hypothetical protein VFN57_07090 [Thermomicrobiaceae bacterium]|nr:hypothetical protein [Thermomicrobiaceae bacterium]